MADLEKINETITENNQKLDAILESNLKIVELLGKINPLIQELKSEIKNLEDKNGVVQDCVSTLRDANNLLTSHTLMIEKGSVVIQDTLKSAGSTTSKSSTVSKTTPGTKKGVTRTTTCFKEMMINNAPVGDTIMMPYLDGSNVTQFESYEQSKIHKDYYDCTFTGFVYKYFKDSGLDGMTLEDINKDREILISKKGINKVIGKYISKSGRGLEFKKLINEIWSNHKAQFSNKTNSNPSNNMSES